MIVPCFNDGFFIGQAVHSIAERESVEIVVVDDGSDDPYTRDVLADLEAEGVRVIHLGENRGVAEARMVALEATSAQYVFPLDADDLAEPGALAMMADLLDSNPDAAVCLGDFIEFREGERVRVVPADRPRDTSDVDRRSRRGMVRREGGGGDGVEPLGDGLVSHVRRVGPDRPESRREAADKRHLPGALREPSTAEREALAAAMGSAYRRRPISTGNRDARIALAIACGDDGAYVEQAVLSLAEQEPVDLIVLDTGTGGSATRAALERLRKAGCVIRAVPAETVNAAREAAREMTAADYVFAVSARDLVVPGSLAKMADRLDASPSAVECVGNYIELRHTELVRASPPRIDPYRLAYTNEYPIAQMYRRAAIDAAGGWTMSEMYEDWDMWMALAERGATSVHAESGRPVYRWRIHKDRRSNKLRRHHRRIYRSLRSRHPDLFARIGEYRRQTDLSPSRRVLYPIVYGARPRFSGEQWIKERLDKLGIWTARQ